MTATEYNKAMIFAGAAPHNISADALPLVDDGRLLRAWIGTVYGMPVATAHGAIYKHASEATHNALRFVSECKKLIAEGDGKNS